MSAVQWIQSIARTNPDLFRALYDFNQRPQFWIHPERMAQLPHTSVLRVLSGTRAGQPYASRWLAKELGLSSCGQHWDFEDARIRLALLPVAALERLAGMCGAVIHGAQIARLIGKADIQALKQAIGADAHAFALRRSKSLLPDLSWFLNGAPEGKPFAQIVVESGWYCMLAALSGAPESIFKRLALKLPPGVELQPLDALSEEQRSAAWTFVRRIAGETLTGKELQCFA